MKVKTKEAKIKEADEYGYLGSMSTDEWKSYTRSKTRILMVKEVFKRKKRLLNSNTVLVLENRVVKCYVFAYEYYTPPKRGL